jgi:hypothetical protein
MAVEYPKDCGANEDMKMTHSSKSLEFYVTDTYPRIKMMGNHAVVNRSSTKHMYFGESNDSGNYLFRGNGKFGIGTTSPNQKLDVEGAIVVGNKVGTPADGTIWYDGTNLRVQINGQSRRIQVT